MNQDSIHAYGELCSLFYDATQKYASNKEVDFFGSFIEQSSGKILEAMSGSGRLQIPLIQRGYSIDGVDNSCAMIARCRQRCVELGLVIPDIYEQSLESLTLPDVYQMVIIAFGSIQLISDYFLVLKSLRNLNAHMMLGGDLLLDVFTPDRTINESFVSIVRLDEHAVIRLTKRHLFNQERKIVDTFCLYELIVDGIVTRQENELIQIAWRSDDAWKELLFQAGFEIIKIYDQYFKNSELSHIIHAKKVKDYCKVFY